MPIPIPIVRVKIIAETVERWNLDVPGAKFADYVCEYTHDLDFPADFPDAAVERALKKCGIRLGDETDFGRRIRLWLDGS